MIENVIFSLYFSFYSLSNLRGIEKHLKFNNLVVFYMQLVKYRSSRPPRDTHSNVNDYKYSKKT